MKARNKARGQIGISGFVDVEHRRADGTLVMKERIKNIVVNGGLQWLKALIGNDGAAHAPLMINLSSNASAPAAADTDLLATIYTAFGLARAASAYAAGATGVFTHYKLFTCSADTKTVASLGLCYADASASLLAGVACTSTTLMNLDTLAVTWTCTITSV